MSGHTGRGINDRGLECEVQNYIGLYKEKSMHTIYIQISSTGFESI